METLPVLMKIPLFTVKAPSIHSIESGGQSPYQDTH